MDPNEFAQAIDQQGQIPAMVPRSRAARPWPPCSSKAKVADTAGVVVDLDALVAGDQTHDHSHDHDHGSDEADEAGDDAEASADEAPVDEAAASKA